MLSERLNIYPTKLSFTTRQIRRLCAHSSVSHALFVKLRSSDVKESHFDTAINGFRKFVVGFYKSFLGDNDFGGFCEKDHGLLIFRAMIFVFDRGKPVNMIATFFMEEKNSYYVITTRSVEQYMERIKFFLLPNSRASFFQEGGTDVVHLRLYQQSLLIPYVCINNDC